VTALAAGASGKTSGAIDGLIADPLEHAAKTDIPSIEHKIKTKR
jgi:hypothetical protein